MPLFVLVANSQLHSQETSLAVKKKQVRQESKMEKQEEKSDRERVKKENRTKDRNKEEIVPCKTQIA